MAKKAKKVQAPEPQPAAPPAPVPKKSPLELLTERVTELEGDLKRLAVLLGRQSGEPIASLAAEIISRKQGA